MQNEIISQIQRQYPNAAIIAATKGKTVDEIISLNHADVGENRVQDFLPKFTALPNLNWHFIGQLQTNKVKYIIDKVKLIQSVDRISLINEISAQAKKHNLTVPVLLQVNIGDEVQKGGIAAENLPNLINYALESKNILLQGLMASMPINASESLYKKMYNIYLQSIKQCGTIKILSMGMSDDYQIALQNGSNMVRLGRVLFS